MTGLSFRCRKARYCFSCYSCWLLGVGITCTSLQRSRILWRQREWAHIIPSLRCCFSNLVRQIEIDNVGRQIFVNILMCTQFIANLGAYSLLSLHDIFFYVLTLFDVGGSFRLTIQCLLVAVFKQVTASLKIRGLQTDWFCIIIIIFIIIISAQLSRSRQSYILFFRRAVSVWYARHGVASLSVNRSRFRLPERSCAVVDGFR